jgi:hypothetical protein
MFASFKYAFKPHETAITVHEIAVDLGWDLSRIQQAGSVHGAYFSRSRKPAQGVSVDMVARYFAASDLLKDSIAF